MAIPSSFSKDGQIFHLPLFHCELFKTAQGEFIPIFPPSQQLCHSCTRINVGVHPSCIWLKVGLHPGHVTSSVQLDRQSTITFTPTDDTSALSGMPWIGFLWCQISNISCVCFSPILIIVYPAWWSLRKLMSKGKQARSTGYILSIELFGLYLPSLQINTQCKLFQTLRWYHLQIEKLATLI